MKLKIFLLTLVLAVFPRLQAGSETIYHFAENQVPVVMTEVRRISEHTEIHLITLEPLKQVCWTFSGPHSPYLLSEGRRHRFLGGDYITACPTTRAYKAGETMILRFSPLGKHVKEFSLVEGQGGENQLIDPSSSRTRYWNFLHVRLE